MLLFFKFDPSVVFINHVIVAFLKVSHTEAANHTYKNLKHATLRDIVPCPFLLSTLHSFNEVRDKMEY